MAGNDISKKTEDEPPTDPNAGHSAPPEVTIEKADDDHVQSKPNSRAEDIVSRSSLYSYGDFYPKAGKFREFTPSSYARLKRRVKEEKRRDEERKNRNLEGRLVDGELKFGDENDEENPIDFDPLLTEGSTLPEDLGDIPPELIGKPIEEIDTNIKHESFVVISKRFGKRYINRFSATNAFFILPPWHALRRLAIRIVTNQAFDIFIMITILVNCVFLALPEVFENAEISEYVFLGIYSVEAIIKIVARGFVINKYTYLRDKWNWLDFGVIILGYSTIILDFTSLDDSYGGSFSALRTFRVFRVIKTVNVVPGLKTIISALLKAIRMLSEVILLTTFCLMVFALFSLQVYAGVLRQKCVKNIPEDLEVSSFYWTQYVKNETNWYMEDSEYIICGNASGSGSCPENFTCLPEIGENPNSGYTSFDNFLWSMLTTFQLITLDFWEDPYNKVIRANGPWNILYFIGVVFFGSFYLINLMLAVVSMSYEEEAVTEKEKERQRKKMKAKANNTKQGKDEPKKSDDKEVTDKGPSAVENSCESSGPSEDARNGLLKSSGNKSSEVNSSSNGTNPSDKSDANTNNKKNSKENTKINNKKKDNQSEEPKDSTSSEGDSNSEEIVERSSSADESKKDQKAVNPLSAMDPDSASITSEENSGDPPVVIVKDENDKDLIDRNCACCSRCCRCFLPWLRFQQVLYAIVSDLPFEIFITICIVLNVIAMGIEHYNMPELLATILKYANYIFTAIFIIEAILKMLALTKHYFKSKWNWFDFIIVLASVVDLGVEGVRGLNILRAFRLLRLLRIFKLAQTWSTMRILLSIIVNTLGALGNLTFVLGIVIYIFAVIGMNFFSKKYTADKFGGDPEDIPRWNFNDFLHSLMLVFRVLCGEWIEPLWDCMQTSGELCMVVFLPTLILGNMMVLNLFLALLLNSFASDSLKRNTDEKEGSTMKRGWSRIKTLFKSKKTLVTPEKQSPNAKLTMASLVQELRRKNALEKLRAEEKIEKNDSDVDIESGEGGKEITTSKGNVFPFPNGDAITIDPSRMKSGSEKSLHRLPGQSTDSETSNSKDGDDKENDEFDEENEETGETEDIEEGEEEYVKPGDVEDCFPSCCYSKVCKCMKNMDQTTAGQGWRKFRKAVHQITEHKAFEYFILLMIFASSITLAFEDIYLIYNETLRDVLYYLDIIFASLFGLEMVLKWIGLGFKKYFTSFWTILDFSIVVISIVSLAAAAFQGADQINSLRALRTLRALRPLRAISRWQGMKIVVNALVYAIPSIFNVLLVCLVFWLLFSIAGVQLFGGKFYKCITPDGAKASWEIVPNRTVCDAMADKGYRWVNAPVHFDDSLSGYLALFQVATFEGWMEVMEDAVDMTDIDLQPRRENSFHSYWFFVVFIIIGSFFTLNLFIGVIIDNFNMLKKKYEGGYLDVFLTPAQKNYYNTMKKLGTKKPQKTIRRPKNRIQALFFDVSVSNKFELAVVLLILTNMIAMAVEHYHQSAMYDDALDVVNIIFTTIFTLEAVIKIFGLRWHYFRRAWNVFDFVIVVLSVAGAVVDDLLRNVFITPTLLRVIRVFRIGRVLRLIKAAKGIRKLLFALVISLPALLNIAFLLFLVVFIYAIFGMTLFGNVKLNGELDDVVNFRTFGSSMVLLFRLTTAAGWNDVLYPLLSQPPDCDPDYITTPRGEKIKQSNGDCGSPGLATFYMVTFILGTYLIIINMYIAVILENFNQAHQQEEIGITEDDFEMFYVVWEQYDPHATQFVKYDQLPTFVADLEEPLGIPKPNEIALVSFNLNIYEGDRLHCLDILLALVKHVLGTVEETSEFKALKTQMELQFREAFPTRVQQRVLSTTMRRKKEDVAVKTLQRAWRKHKAQKNMRHITEIAVETHLGRSLTRGSFSLSSRRPSNTSSKRGSITGSVESSRKPDGKQKIELQKKASLGNRLQVPATSLMALTQGAMETNV